MDADDAGCACDIGAIVKTTDQLANRTVQKVNDTQELVMVNDFARETNESLFKKCLQDRISDIASWRWVLEDLSKRLEDSIGLLKYELKAVNVVVRRLKDEILENCRSNCRPGNLCPGADDPVEDAIQKETSFLREQKRTFEDLVTRIEKQTASLERTRDRIKNDILAKQETLEIEEGVANICLGDCSIGKRKKMRPTSLCQWESRCLSLKQEGLQALSKTLMTRQEARGARVFLTIKSQALGNLVDFFLKKRIHAYHSKLVELDWQRQEAIKDIQALEEEKTSTEKCLLANMEQKKRVEARLSDRSHRPTTEHTKDDVDQKLKDELCRVGCFIKDLRINFDEITGLQNHLKDQLTKMDCVAEDIISVLRVDEERMLSRLGDQSATSLSTSSPSPSNSTANRQNKLNTIREENEDVEDEEGDNEEEEVEEEEDDYPFSD